MNRNIVLLKINEQLLAHDMKYTIDIEKIAAVIETMDIKALYHIYNIIEKGDYYTKNRRLNR